MAFQDLKSRKARKAHMAIMVTSNHQWLVRAGLRLINMPEANWKCSSDKYWITSLMNGMARRHLIRKAHNETTELSTLMSPKQWDVLKDRTLKYLDYLEHIAE